MKLEQVHEQTQDPVQAQINEWINDVKMEDIPASGCGQFLAQKLGMERFLRLVFVAGGITAYIPKADTILKRARNQRIINEFDGSNYKDLALKYNLSDTWVREVIQADQDEKCQGKLDFG